MIVPPPPPLILKTTKQIVSYDIIDKVQFSNCVCKYQSFYKKKPGQVGFCPDKKLFADYLPGDK